MTAQDFFYVFPISLGLSADCFAVALSGGIALKATFWQVLRISLAFGVSQAVMSVLGWLAGRAVLELISGYDHWLAFLLLAFVGGRMLWESLRHEEKRRNVDITRGILLLTLSLATSIDSLATGLSFAFLDINIAFASLTIGVVALIVTAIGFVLGKNASAVIGRRAETVGGIILIAIGLRILLTHIL